MTKIPELQPNKVRVYICPNCQHKYWPNKHWDRICPDCDEVCLVKIIIDNPEVKSA